MYVRAMRNEDFFRNKVVLVTGAAGGIGRATALRLAERGASLILCDRDAAGLREVESAVGARTEVLHSAELDVSARDSYRDFADEVHRRVPAIDVLVNNAGVAVVGGLLDTPLEDIDWVLSINLGGVIHGCHFFCPNMVKVGQGHVVNVASVLGLMATSESFGYSAAKFGVVGLSEAMRAELRPKGVFVSTVCPGMINTNIAKDGRHHLRGGAKGQAKVVSTFERFGHPPELVAKVIEDAIVSRKSLVPATPEAWAFWFAKRIAPNAFERIGSFVAGRTLRRASPPQGD